MVYNCFGVGSGYGMMGWGGWGGIFGLVYLLILVGIVVLLYLWIAKLWKETRVTKRK